MVILKKWLTVEKISSSEAELGLVKQLKMAKDQVLLLSQVIFFKQCQISGNVGHENSVDMKLSLCLQCANF